MIYVAIDCDNTRDILDHTRTLSRAKGSYGFKLNLDTLLNLDASSITTVKLVQRLKSLDKPIFLDIKMSNGDRTMMNVVKNCIDMQIDIINVYPNIGRTFLTNLVKMTRGTKTKIFVLTVLTHYDDAHCQEFYRRDLKEVVRHFALIASECKADGIILPPTCLNSVTDIDIIKMCPGIREEQDDHSNNQIQSTTASEAFANGAHYLVIGSPITKSDNMAAALDKFTELT
jgi:orotidine-5'-phosphate decarboxylase